MSGRSTAACLGMRRGIRAAIVAALALVFAISLAAATGAPAQSLQERLDETEGALSQSREREGVLTSEISRYSNQISSLSVKVAALRNREAIVQQQLDRKQAELEAEQRRLEILRARLARAIAVLEDRLVAIYKSSDPDMITVLLNADGFDAMLEQVDYLRRIEDQDSSIVDRVRTLRDETKAAVARIREARDTIARRRAELERTRSALEARTAQLAVARERRQGALKEVRAHRRHLEADLSEISEQIQEQLSSLSSPLPAGPIRGGSSGMIWPVNGPVVSGYGWRWGRMHEGVDIAVPAGTPIRAAKSGNIVLAGYTGGYGNYTCIDHGGGLSTCYAHQSGYARTSGFVSQGTVIGYVGCTGHCFGDHLHFEVRVNGAAVDPLGYL